MRLNYQNVVYGFSRESLRRRIRMFFLILFMAAAGIANAQEVSVKYKGLILNADLALAEGKTFKDGVILITHGSLAHRDMDTLVYLRSLLKDFEYNTLAINLSLGISNRHGMYDCQIPHRHHNDDAIEEIDAWLQWLKKQGAEKVTLLGHSLGGAQTALYAAKKDSSLIQSVILLAPATKNNDIKSYPLSYKVALKQAQKLIEEGKGETELEHSTLMHCSDTKVAATSFVSYNAPSKRLDTPSLLPEISKPVLVIIAGDDQVVLDLETKIKPLADGQRIQMEVIEGAGHFFRDLIMDVAVERIDEFLK